MPKSNPSNSSSERSTTRHCWLVRVFWFYVNGFRDMTLGKTLWAIILLKLFIMFAVLKLFFFPNFLARKGDAQARADYVGEQLTQDLLHPDTLKVVPLERKN